MTAPNDTYPQPAAQPNVAPSQSGLAQPQNLGQNHAAPGSFVPSSNALQGYFPIPVASRHTGNSWVIPLQLPYNKNSLNIDFNYSQIGIQGPIRSIGFRGLCGVDQAIFVIDATRVPALLAVGAISGTTTFYTTTIMPIIAQSGDEFNCQITTNALFLAQQWIILYQEEQLPINIPV